MCWAPWQAKMLCSVPTFQQHVAKLVLDSMLALCICGTVLGPGQHLFSTPAATRSTVLALVDGSYDCEQTALMQVRAENPSEFDAHTAMVPWNVMNTLGIPNYCEGDFVVHAAGGGNRLESYFFGNYGSKWGEADKYQQLEEFMFHMEAQKVGQRLRGNPSGSETRCGEFVPQKEMVAFMVVRRACFVLAVSSFAVAAWNPISHYAKILWTGKAAVPSFALHTVV